MPLQMRSLTLELHYLLKSMNKKILFKFMGLMALSKTLMLYNLLVLRAQRVILMVFGKIHLIPLSLHC